LVVGVLAHGAIEELDPTAVLLQFLDDQHLMHVRARQAIRGGQQHHVVGRQSGLIAQRIQARPVQARPAVTVIAVDVPLLHRPPPLLDCGAQPRHLLLDGLCLRLVRRRDAHIQGL